jgi:hypothetical protein
MDSQQSTGCLCKRLHGETMNERNKFHKGIVSAKATVKYYRLGRKELDAICEGDEHPRPILDKFDSLLQRAARMFWK